MCRLPPATCRTRGCRGFPTSYSWCWIAVGYVIGSILLFFGSFVLACTVLGGEAMRSVCTATHAPLCWVKHSNLPPSDPAASVATPPPILRHVFLSFAAPKKVAQITEQEFQEFELSRQELASPRTSLDTTASADDIVRLLRDGSAC